MPDRTQQPEAARDIHGRDLHHSCPNLFHRRHLCMTGLTTSMLNVSYRFQAYLHSSMGVMRNKGWIS